MSPRRDDVPALAHNFRLFGANNLCFLVFSSICGRSMHYLWIAFSHSTTSSKHTRTHADVPLWLGCLPRMTKSWYYLLLFIIADGAPHFMTALLTVLSCMFLFIHASITFSLPALATSLNVHVDSDVSLFFLSISLSSPSFILCPAFVTSLVSITTVTSPSHLTIFNQKHRKQRQDEIEKKNVEGKITQMMHHMKKQRNKNWCYGVNGLQAGFSGHHFYQQVTR